MAFIAIYTPRTASKQPAIVIPPTHLRNRGAIRRVMRDAEAQIPRSQAGSAAWKPIKLGNAIGVSVPVRMDTGNMGREIYLLCGVDAPLIDDETTRSIQSRLANQIATTAETLITSGIPWGHRRESSHKAQFPGGDFAMRNELTSYAMMFHDLPEVASFKASGAGKRNKWVNWAVVLLIPLFATAAYFLYTKISEGLTKPGPSTDKMAPLSIPSNSPPPMPLASPGAARVPKPIAMPDPFEDADLTELEKSLLELRDMRSQLLQEKPQVTTPQAIAEWEKKAIRYNRRRQQLIRAFGKLETEAGQSALEPVFIEEFGVDLYMYPDRMVKARGDLEIVREELIARREAIDTTNLAHVEDYNDEVEWFNLRADAFNRAVERAKTWGPPPDASPAASP